MSSPTYVTNPVTDAPVELWRPACAIVGLFYAGTGIRGILNPIGEAHFFGLRDTTGREATFFPPLAGRNLSLGFAVFAYIATGERRALGILLASFSVAGVTDLFLVASTPGVAGTKVLLHALKCGIMAYAGGALLDYY